MAKQTIISSNGPITAPAASAVLCSVTVAQAQAANWQNGTWFNFNIIAYIDGTGVPATDDDNAKIQTNGALLANHVSLNGNGAAAAGGLQSVFSGNAQWNGVGIPIQFLTVAAGSASAVYHATIMATAIDTPDDLPGN